MQTKTETNQCEPEGGPACEFKSGNECHWGDGKPKFLHDPKGKNKRDCNLIKEKNK